MKLSRLMFAAFFLAACNSDRTTGPIATGSTARLSESHDNQKEDESDDDDNGVVFALSNQVGGNALLRFNRASDGSLTPAGSYATGGNGTGAGLGSQGAIAFGHEHKLLFAVNAGSSSISTFRLVHGQPVLVNTVTSGGQTPISLTTSDDLLYVVNAGGAGNISGFRFNGSGKLAPIPNSSRPLSTGASAPAQIGFDPSGSQLVVTEKAAKAISSYSVGKNGLATPGTVTPSSGTTPFGFAFRRNVLIVSEAFGGAPNASATSSYALQGTGPYAVISASVPTTETAACWTVVSQNGRFAYVSNTGSGTITGYGISSIGALTPLTANGETAVLGAGTGPLDMALSDDGRFLYALNGGNRTISVVRVNSNGSLTVLSGGASGLPAGMAGLVAQ